MSMLQASHNTRHQCASYFQDFLKIRRKFFCRGKIFVFAFASAPFFVYYLYFGPFFFFISSFFLRLLCVTSSVNIFIFRSMWYLMDMGLLDVHRRRVTHNTNKKSNIHRINIILPKDVRKEPYAPYDLFQIKLN